MEEIRSAFLSNQETLCSLIPQEEVVLWFQLLKKLLNFKRFEELFGLCWSQRSSDCPFNGMLVAVDHAVPQVMMSPKALKTIGPVLLFTCLTPLFAPAGLAYSNLVYDWVKAAVMFGVTNTIARLDHLDPPQPPKCITMLYVFAET